MDQSELRRDAIRAFGAFDSPKVSQTLLSRFGSVADDDKRAIVEVLASRKSYANALVDALANQTVHREEIPAHVARSMKSLLGDSFTKVYGEVRELAVDREKVMAKYKNRLTPQALSTADPSAGRAVFQKTCAACHQMYGTGGKVGPDLTGSNRANLDYLLLNSVDPSYDVPEGYRMVIIQTVDGRVLNGVIAEENQQRVVLKTVDQPEMVILKTDIEARKTSEKSIMPDGQLDQMRIKDVINLVKYMQTKQQVELPQ
jgi:putative heme-binding domain-containing protein